MDMDEWMAAIERGLAKRDDDGRRARAARARGGADEEFSAEFLNMARKVLRVMIDADGGGTLSKAEIVDAVKNNDEVIKFLSNCGNENLQSLLVPSRLEHALNCLDTDSDGEITAPEWCASGLKLWGAVARRWRCGDGVLWRELRRRRGRKRVEALRGSPVYHNAGKRHRAGPQGEDRAAPRGPRGPAAADRRELEAFKEQFLNAAGRSSRSSTRTATAASTKSRCDAVTHDKKVISFLGSCGEPICSFAAAEAPREGVEGAGHVADGEIDADECAARVLPYSIDATPVTAWRRL